MISSLASKVNVEEKHLKDVAAKTRTENSETQWAGKPALREALFQSLSAIPRPSSRVYSSQTRPRYT
jgi:hypothetical protein